MFVPSRSEWMDVGNAQHCQKMPKEASEWGKKGKGWIKRVCWLAWQLARCLVSLELA